VYEERNSVPGVKFTDKGQEMWSPVVRRSEKKKPASKGDGSRNNPVRDDDIDVDVEPRLRFAKDIRFMESPGLSYRKGKTNHSFRWIPITVNSPISSRTRIKTKK
jgi:hypothetical protein